MDMQNHVTHSNVTPMSPAALRAKAAAAYLSISERKLALMVGRNEVHSVLIGGCRLFPIAGLNALLESRPVEAACA